MAVIRKLKGENSNDQFGIKELCFAIMTYRYTYFENDVKGIALCL